MDDKTRAAEQVLLRDFRNGNPEAFDGLIALFYQKFVLLANSILDNRQDAEEVVQDAFLRAYRAIDSFRGDSSFETWMHRIIMNLARNRYHWNQRRGAGLHVSINAAQGFDSDPFEPEKEWDLPDDRMQPDRVLEAAELEQDVSNIIDSLPEKFRETLVMRHYGEKSYQEIASETGVPVNTVKTRIKRARELVRAKLMEQCRSTSIHHRHH